MRLTLLAVLATLLVVPPIARAEGDTATSQIPAKSPVCIRIKSLDRVDVIAKEWMPLLKAFGLDEQAQMLAGAPLSQILFMQSGMNPEMVDSTKPIYVGFAGDEQPVIVFTAAAPWEGEKVLNDGAVAVHRDGVGIAGPKTAVAAATRGAPCTMLDGDVVVHAYLGDLAAEHKDTIDAAFKEALDEMKGDPDVPAKFQPALEPMTAAVRELVDSVDSIDYAVSWNGANIASEGILRTKARTSLRESLQRAGKPGNASSLVGFLPKDAIFVTERHAAPGWPDKDLVAMFDKVLGEGVSAPLVAAFNATAPLSDLMTGTSAGSFSLSFINVSAIQIAPLKEGADVAAAMEKFDVAASNEALKAFGLPMTMTLEKAVDEHDGLKLHRITIASEDQQIAQFMAGTQTYFAVGNGYLFSVTSPVAADDLKGLIDQVKMGARIEHPHTKAMAGISNAYNFSFSINMAAVRDYMKAWVAFLPPEAGEGLAAVPDDFVLATAITCSSGDIHWRGNWPVQPIVKIAKAVAPKAVAPAGADEEFD